MQQPRANHNCDAGKFRIATVLPLVAAIALGDVKIDAYAYDVPASSDVN